MLQETHHFLGLRPITPVKHPHFGSWTFHEKFVCVHLYNCYQKGLCTVKLKDMLLLRVFGK